jgi:hypothetical protein
MKLDRIDRRGARLIFLCHDEYKIEDIAIGVKPISIGF